MGRTRTKQAKAASGQARPIGRLIAAGGAISLALAGLIAGPIAVADEPEQETVQADSIEVTESSVPLVPAVVEEGYTDAPAVEEAVGDAQQEEAVDPEVVPDAPVESAIARVDLQSDIAVLGVTWDPGAITPEEVAYRVLEGDIWSEWGLVEYAVVPEGVTDIKRAGTDPVTLTNVRSIEVVARAADGTEIPGVAISVIDPRAAAEVENALEVPEEQPQSAAPVEPAPSQTDLPESESSQSNPSEDSVTDSPSEPSSDGGAPSEETPIEEPSGGSNSEPTSEPQDEGSTPVEGHSGQAEFAGAAQATAAIIEAAGVTPTFSNVSLNSAGTQFTTGKNGLVINTRRAWGANEAWMKYPYEGVRYQGAVIHHTAGSNNYTKEQVPGQIRGIYNYHANTLGWGDIGYQLLVDKFGGVWEGRSGGLTRSNIGAQAYGANRQTFGISVLGDYTNSAPPAAAMEAVAKTVAWKLQVHGINSIDGSIWVPGSDNKGRYIPVVSGHRNVGGTSCPGQAFYNQLPNLRTKIKSYMNTGGGTKPSTPTAPGLFAGWGATTQIGQGWPKMSIRAGDWNGDGHPDMMLVDGQGRLWLYPGSGNGFSARTQIGHGWQEMTWIQSGVDWDGDGKVDIVARHRSGDLYLYSGNGRGGISKSRKIGIGWNGLANLTLARTASGPAIYGTLNDRLYIYPGNGKGGFNARTITGTGWSSITAIAAVGDWTGDGRPDLIARNRAGDLWLYEANAAGVPGKSQKIGNGWNMMSGFGVANQSAKKSPLWALANDGRLLSYPVR